MSCINLGEMILCLPDGKEVRHKYHGKWYRFFVPTPAKRPNYSSPHFYKKINGRWEEIGDPEKNEWDEYWDAYCDFCDRSRWYKTEEKKLESKKY